MNTLTLELSSFVANRNTHSTLKQALMYRTMEHYSHFTQKLAKELEADVQKVNELTVLTFIAKGFEALCSAVHEDVLYERLQHQSDMPEGLAVQLKEIIDEHGRTDLPMITKEAAQVLKGIKIPAGQELVFLAMYTQDLSLSTVTPLIEALSEDERKAHDAMTKGRISDHIHIHSTLEVFEA